jgi:hypothetical protein
MSNSALLPLRLMARHLGVSKKWLQCEAESGRVPCLNADGRLLFNQHAVVKAIEERAAQSTHTPNEPTAADSTDLGDVLYEGTVLGRLAMKPKGGTDGQ